MPDFRKVYAARPGGAGAKVSPPWSIGQLKSVSPDTALGWNNFTCHLTVERWEVSGTSQRIGEFHLSFKFWKKQSLAGPHQPGCTWRWNGLTRFDFRGWFQVPYLYLEAGQSALVANAVKEFMRRHADLIFIDSLKEPTMWATLEAQLQSPTNP